VIAVAIERPEQEEVADQEARAPRLWGPHVDTIGFLNAWAWGGAIAALVLALYVGVQIGYPCVSGCGRGFEQRAVNPIGISLAFSVAAAGVTSLLGGLWMAAVLENLDELVERR
jgi:hypothetical protein